MNAATALVATGMPDARRTASTTPSPTARVQLVAVNSKVLIAPDTSRCAKGPAKIALKSRRPNMLHSFCQSALTIHIQLAGNGCSGEIALHLERRTGSEPFVENLLRLTRRLHLHQCAVDCLG